MLGRRMKKANNQETRTIPVKAPIYRDGKRVAQINVGRALPRENGGFTLFLNAFPVAAEAVFFVDTAEEGRFRVSSPREGNEGKTFWVPVGTAFIKKVEQGGKTSYRVAISFDAVPFESRLLIGDRDLSQKVEATESEGDELEEVLDELEELDEVPWE